MMPPSLVPNPLTDVVVHAVDGKPAHVDVSAYSLARGFTRVRLSRGQAPGFETALRFLASTEGGDPAYQGLSSAETLWLWQSGLLVVPHERADALTPDTPTPPRDAYVENGCMLIPACLTPAAVTALVQHYRTLVTNGTLERGDRLADRYFVHNDPAGRVVQRALHGLIERIVGSPIKGSYTYASLYCGGTALPLHTDRVQCRYSVSVLIDYHPLPADGRSPWPVHIVPTPDAPPVACHQPIGGGLLFRGHEIPHARPTLPVGEDCWVMLLHYVDADFDGPLD